MKTSIIYMSKHGTTAYIARLITSSINKGEVLLHNLKENRNPDISKSDRIIIGGSIHAGMIQKRVKDFCKLHLKELLTKELGLFICGMEKAEMQKQYENAFPKELRDHARARMLPGGEFKFEKMNFLEKAIVKKVSGQTNSISELDESLVSEFVSGFNSI